jgi:predicted transcriptional regulator
VIELEGLCNLLFELSNEDRVKILIEIRREKHRISDLSNKLDLSIQEVSRHVSRLNNVGLLKRDLEGFYDHTPLGRSIFLMLPGIDFLYSNREYFISHDISQIENSMLQRIGELSNASLITSMIEFLQIVEKIVSEAEEYLWLQIWEYPLLALNVIKEALKKGVSIRIIEPRRGVTGPQIDLFEDIKSNDGKYSVEKKLGEIITAFLCISEKESLLGFSMEDGFDYRGFNLDDEVGMAWCRDYYDLLWHEAVEIKSPMRIETEITAFDKLGKSITIEGKNNSEIDVKAIQNAVDNYDEVILKGVFNLGYSQKETTMLGEFRERTLYSIWIRKSVDIKGEGRVDGVPETQILKQGWTFPYDSYDCVFYIESEDIDVTVENLHFTDFNCYAIHVERAGSVYVGKNRITLDTGLGRGMTFGNYGDLITGINVSGSCPNGVIIENNYLDFATSLIRGGYLSPGLYEDPNYRPNLAAHENYIGIGILVNLCTGKVVIRDNKLNNMNDKGICVLDNYESAEIFVKNNIIKSDIFGAYAWYSKYAGHGILVQSAHSRRMPSFHIEIEGNEISLSKVNYSGISIYGPVQSESQKMSDGIIKNNEIYLENGAIGILIRKSDRFYISENKIQGNAYYGIQVSGRESRDNDLHAIGNILSDNDFTELKIKEPDKYCKDNMDGRLIAVKDNLPWTGNFWFNKYTKKNQIIMHDLSTIYDQGTHNITRKQN